MLANASKSPRRTSSRFPLFRARTLPAQTQRRTVSVDRPVSRAASLISNSSWAIPATNTFYYIRRGVVEVIIEALGSWTRAGLTWLAVPRVPWVGEPFAGRARKAGHHRAARGAALGSPRWSRNFLMAVASYPRADDSPAIRAFNSAPGNAGSRRHPGWGTPRAPRSVSGIRPARLSDDGKHEADSLLDPGRWSRRSAVS